MSKSLKKARTYCEENKYRFTEPRERVLKTLLNHNKPMGAYDIIKALSTKQHQVKPGDMKEKYMKSFEVVRCIESEFCTT